MDIEKIVTDIVEEHLSVQAGKELDANIHDRFGADDLDVLEIIMEIEEQLNVDIPDGDYDTVQDFINVTLKVTSGEE